MKPICIAIGYFLATIHFAHANGCRVQKVVQEVAVAVPVVPVIQAVTIPLYNYSYAPPVYAPPPQPVYQQPQQQVYQPPQQQVQQQQVQQQAVEQPVDCCAALVAELAKLRAEIAALRGAAPILPPAPPTQLPADRPIVGSILQAKCASCHTQGKNPQGDFSIFLADGRRAPLSIQQKARIQRRVLSGDMPKPLPGAPHQPLSQAEKDALLKELELAQATTLPAPAPAPAPVPAPVPQ